ncbi:MAG: SDR family oxidoreductase [Anaerolineae bacterium]
MPVCIYRLEAIVGDSRTGAWNTSDFLCRYIKGCVQLGSMPRIDEMLHLTPVDYVSRALVHLSTRPASMGRILNMLAPQLVHQSRLAEWLCALGYPVQEIPYDVWVERLIEAAGFSEGNVLPEESVRLERNELYSLIPLFIEKVPSTSLTVPQMFTQDREPKLDGRNVIEGLAGTGITCPPIDVDLFAVFLSYFVRSGFLGAAGTV